MSRCIDQAPGIWRSGFDYLIQLLLNGHLSSVVPGFIGVADSSSFRQASLVFSTPYGTRMDAAGVGESSLHQARDPRGRFRTLLSVLLSSTPCGSLRDWYWYKVGVVIV